MQKALETWSISLGSLLVSVLLVALFIASTGNGPGDVFYSLYRGAFGSWFSWQNTMVRAAPLFLTALCTALPARVGLIVIGGEGAFVVGGLSATMAGVAVQNAPPVVVLSIMMLVASLTAGAWIMAVGALRYYRNVNETISSLLLNYIAIAILNFLVIGVLRDPATLNNPSTYAIGDQNMLGAIGASNVHWGLIYGITACTLMWVMARKSTFGFAADVTGGNIRAARLVGLPVAKIVLISCFLGGAAAGIAGAVEIAAVQGRANAALNAGYGYAGILVAFLARHNPLAIIPYALLLGGIQAAGGLLQRQHDLPDATVAVIQGIIFIVILSSEMLYGRMRWFQPRQVAKNGN